METGLGRAYWERHQASWLDQTAPAPEGPWPAGQGPWLAPPAWWWPFALWLLPALAAGHPSPAPAAPAFLQHRAVRDGQVGAGRGRPARRRGHPAPGGTTCTYAVGTNSLGVQVTFLQVPWPAFEAVEQDYLKGGAMKVDGVGQPAFAVASRTHDL